MKTTKKRRRVQARLRPRRGKIGWAEHRSIISRLNSVSVCWPQVADFRDPSLREAFRVWWHPIDLGPDFDELTGQRIRVTGRRSNVPRRVTRLGPTITAGFILRRRELDPEYHRNIAKFMRRLPRRGKKTRRKRAASAKEMIAAVVIALDYPLARRHTKVVTIDRRYPGAIFALAHDFYRELYAEDEKLGGKAGPMNGGKGPLLNRGRGPLIWGHDLGDLAFEGCTYRKFTAAESKKHGGAEGEFTFDIGS